MQSKRRLDQQRKFNDFLLQLSNLSTFAPFAYPIMQVDTTAVNNLRIINRQTAKQSSQEAQILHFKSQQLLRAFEDVKQLYQNFAETQSQIQISKRPNQFINKQKIDKKRQENKRDKKCIVNRANYDNQTENINNQNVDLSNFQHLKCIAIKHKRLQQSKPININIELKQIIRPEYRIQQQSKLKPEHCYDSLFAPQIQKKRKDEKKVEKNTKYVKIRQSEEYEDLPPVCLRKKRSLSRSDASARSVSPKLERARNATKSNLNNISEISRNYQSGSDVSFEIDLNSMGIFPQGPLNFKNSQQANQKQSNIRRKPRALSKPAANQIQEQEPWECDQEEIEEQIRQIDERLSHRAYRTHRVQTQIQHECQLFQQHQPKQQRVQKRNIHFFQPKNRQPKTVRLSFTPQKHKKNTNQQHKKVEVKRVEVLLKDQGRKPLKRQNETLGLKKLQGDRKILQNKQKYELKSQIQKEAQEEDMIFAKWKKPNRGTIELDLRRYAK